jgi:hypothetical protein
MNIEERINHSYDFNRRIDSRVINIIKFKDNNRKNSIIFANKSAILIK